jgi:hypothetical protein
MDEAQKVALGDIIESSPVAYGLDSGVWTSPMIGRVILDEFGIDYHPGHVRKLLRGMGFSVQRPRRVLARADPTAQNRWHRRTFPSIKKSAPQRLSANLHGRGLIPAGFDLACNLGANGSSARRSRDRRT